MNETSEQQEDNNTSVEKDLEALIAVVPILVPILFTFIFIVGFIGNILVILVVFYNKTMRNTTNILIFNLAVSMQSIIILRLLNFVCGVKEFYESPEPTACYFTISIKTKLYFIEDQNITLAYCTHYILKILWISVSLNVSAFWPPVHSSLCSFYCSRLCSHVYLAVRNSLVFIRSISYHCHSPSLYLHLGPHVIGSVSLPKVQYEHITYFLGTLYH